MGPIHENAFLFGMAMDVYESLNRMVSEALRVAPFFDDVLNHLFNGTS